MEGNRKNASKTRRGPITFSPTTHVRNQIETGANVERANYNVNATRNNKMPGYALGNRRFRPHSKSLLQASISQIAQQRKQKKAEIALRGLAPDMPRQMNHIELNSLTTGLQPAVSSVGIDDKAAKAAQAASVANIIALKSEFGNAWFNANISREEIMSEKTRSEAEAAIDYHMKLNQFEYAFYDKFGYYAPSQLKRIRDEHLKAELEFGNASNYQTYRENLDYWETWYNEQLRLIPPALIAACEKRVTKMMSDYKQILDDIFSRTIENLQKIKKGNPFPAAVKIPLANRLLKAKAVHNSFV